MKFKAGDHVRIVGNTQGDCKRFMGDTGTLIDMGGGLCVVFDDNCGYGAWKFEHHEDHAGKKGWYVDAEDLEKVKDESFSLGVPSIADDLKLTPQARKVLAHLRAGKSISPLEAQNVYGVYRLAGRILEIRRSGYNVRMERREDEAGHKYGRYFLAA